MYSMYNLVSWIILHIWDGLYVLPIKVVHFGDGGSYSFTN
jgi:hypothetical protein